MRLPSLVKRHTSEGALHRSARVEVLNKELGRPCSTTLAITPFDPSAIKDIERAINVRLALSGTGLSCSTFHRVPQRRFFALWIYCAAAAAAAAATVAAAALPDAMPCCSTALLSRQMMTNSTLAKQGNDLCGMRAPPVQHHQASISKLGHMLG
eukprot:1143575-Pelagomonas_calceolata.AAC.5